MKKYFFLIFACCMLLALDSNAQQRLTGPAAKNATPSEKTKPGKFIVAKSGKGLTGPRAKNGKPGVGKKDIKRIASAKSKRRKGPKGKNRLTL